MCTLKHKDFRFLCTSQMIRKLHAYVIYFFLLFQMIYCSKDRQFSWNKSYNLFQKSQLKCIEIKMSTLIICSKYITYYYSISDKLHFNCRYNQRATISVYMYCSFNSNITYNSTIKNYKKLSISNQKRALVHALILPLSIKCQSTMKGT